MKLEAARSQKLFSESDAPVHFITSWQLASPLKCWLMRMLIALSSCRWLLALPVLGQILHLTGQGWEKSIFPNSQLWNSPVRAGKGTTDKTSRSGRINPAKNQLNVRKTAGSHKPGIFEPSVLSGTDPLQNTAFDLRSCRRLPNLSDRSV